MQRRRKKLHKFKVHLVSVHPIQARTTETVALKVRKSSFFLALSAESRGGRNIASAVVTCCLAVALFAQRLTEATPFKHP